MGVSVWQILIILLIVLLLFGAGRLPTLMGDLAKGIKSFKSGLRDEGDMDEAGPDRTIEAKPAAPTTHTEIEKDRVAKT